MEYKAAAYTRDRRAVVYLPPEEYTGYILPIGYTTDGCYAVDFTESADGWQIGIHKTALAAPITHTPEEYDFPDKLYEPYWEKAEAYGIFSDAGELIGAIEICAEEWSHRMRVTELWVSPAYHKRGYGHTLLSLVSCQRTRANLRMPCVDFGNAVLQRERRRFLSARGIIPHRF